ncbi:MAG: carboxy terminal-processing peptidase, partial [Pseudomonadales bacterium]
ADVNEFEIYRYTLDDALRIGDVRPAFEMFNRYQKRVITRFGKIIASLEAGVDGYDFTRQERLMIDRKDAPWLTTEPEVDDLWRRRLKDTVLAMKLSDEERTPEKIQEILLKRYKNRLTRTKQTNSEDVYQLFMNAFTKTYDPHTQYFSPRTSENFNINMSLSLEGIGAVLQTEDENTKVVSLMPAGPADKAGELKPSDKIIGVAQGEDGELVDVVGWRLDEVVQLIRGKKGTVVRLNIIPAASDTGESKVISITRNRVQLEEQSAQAEVIDIELFGHTRKIGVIDIPIFYMDFKAQQEGDDNYKSTTRDVIALIEDLKAQQVDGIIMDLRNNSGGSLQEAKTLTSLFVKDGPAVLVRSKNNRVDVLAARNIQPIYDGPLGVMVNRLSASASEIFAGAMQDHERGIIIGSQTFGKGTVQQLLPLNRGQLKLTQAKFYRISGDSTQHKGIIPDILYPPSYDPESIGESTLKAPLVWDRIFVKGFQPKHSLKELVPELRALHEARVAEHPEFNYQKEAFAYRKAKSEKNFVTLNRQARIAEQDDSEAFWVALENKKRVAQGLETIASLDDLNPKEEDELAAAEEPIGSDGGSSASGGGAIVPDAQEGDEPAQGSEMAIADPIGSLGTEPNAEPSVEPSTEPIAEPGTEPEAIEASEAEPEDPPDPYLVESGHILLDLISLKEQTA